MIREYKRVCMKKENRVSIIVPCYNHEKFLDDCMLGILEQDYKDIEVLICDDCSLDNSYNIIISYEERLRERFSNVVILKNEVNQGVTKNINRMLELAEGEYIKVIASDDVLAPTAISDMVSYMEQNPDAGIVISNGVRITEDEHHGGYEPKMRIYDVPLELSGDTLLEKTYAHNDIFAPGAFIRKSLFEKVGFYDESVAIEDLEFWLRVLTKSNETFVFLDKDLILYRINENSMTSMVSNERLEGRRIRFHQAEIAILLKYKDAVSQQLYAKTILERLMAEKGMAVGLQLKNLEKLVNTELKDFDGWKYVSIKEKAAYILKNMKWLVKKVIHVVKR